jgi:hypothetical protein
LRAVVGDRLGVRLLERGGELDTPLDAGAVHPQEGNAHDENDECGDDGEGALPELLGLGPEVDELDVELRV